MPNDRPDELHPTETVVNAAGNAGSAIATATIGPYQFIRKLGEGGMGQVWLAQQTAPVERLVALKLILGSRFDAAGLHRFRAERQSLALMNHPAIAKVFDAGETQDGQPYFVMEYVAGLPITHYCDQKKLKLRQRLELFLEVCRGVQHAHQKTIVHRDLKPSNILVVDVDGRPTPRIIDFGLAKAIESQPAVQGLTQVGGFVGTPGYMSPEQSDPNVVDVDIRTDVYALGVVLYELLTGLMPFDPQQWKKRPYDEMLRHLREDDPPSPSSRITMDRSSLANAAGERETSPKQLISTLRGDLDRIAMKALAKDRNLRYETASELAADITRYLNNEPILARPASRVYRITKYVQRHKMGVASAAIVVLLLVAFGITELLQVRRITRERDRANHITNFVTTMFKVSDPSEARGNTVTAREILDGASKDVESGLSNDLELRASLMNVMGKVYDNIGLYSRAERLAAQALEIQRRIHGPDHIDTLHATSNLANILSDEGHNAEAEKLYRQALDARRRTLGREHPETLGNMMDLANAIFYQGHHADAEKLFREALDIQRRVEGPEHPETLNTMANLANALSAQNKSAEAEQLSRQALDAQRRIHGPQHPMTLQAMANLAYALSTERKYAEAEKLYRDAWEIERRVFGPEHVQTLQSMVGVAYILENEGRHKEAAKLDQETLELQRHALGREHPDTLLTMSNLAAALESLGQHTDAEKLNRETLEIQRRVLGSEHPDTLRTAVNLADELKSMNHLAEAEKLGRQTLDAQRRVLGPNHPDTIVSMSNLSSVLAAEGHYQEAEQIGKEAVDVRHRTLGPNDPDTAALTYNLACVAARQGHLDQAFALLRDSMDHGLAAAALLGIEEDTDLKSLRTDPRFAPLAADAHKRAAAH
jgi:non-specific serine/threonine protein kinase/serine/threonine-protein kinase